MEDRTPTICVSKVKSDAYVSHKDQYWDQFLFLLYISPILEIARLNNICIMIYADDTQLFTV